MAGRELHLVRFESVILTKSLITLSQGIHMRSPKLRSCQTVPDQLRKALSRGMLEEFWSLIKEGADIDTKDHLERTPLHLVIYWKKDLAVVKAVLSAGANPNAVDHHGFTPLHAAVHSNSTPAIIKDLISAGAEVDMPDSRGKTPLMKSLNKQDNRPIIRTLLSAGADVKVPNLMVEAVKAKCDHEILRTFIMAGASVNNTTCGYSPLSYAVSNGDPTVVKMLLVAGARANFLRPESASTLLHHATVAEIARDLIKYGVDVNAVDNKGETPLHKAVMGDHLDVAKTLINAGADVNYVVHGRGNTCLHLAKSPSVVRLLVSRGLDINARNRRGEIPLHSLVTGCSILLSPVTRVRGLYIRYFKDKHCVKMGGAILAAKEMIKYGANVNASNYNDRTILESVVTHGHSKMVSYMLKSGVEVCWKKLFRLTAVNQSALQLLIRESLIGNVKGDSLLDYDLDEEPFLQSLHNLLRYAKRCIFETKLMKVTKVNCFKSIYHYVVETAPKIKSLRLCSLYKLTEADIVISFPIYKNHVAGRLSQCHRRGLLLRVLENFGVWAPSVSGGGKVHLINDCKFAIAEYLNNQELFNFLVAIGYEELEENIFPKKPPL